MKLALMLLLLVQLIACPHAFQSKMPDNYDKALEHGLATIPFAHQFQEIFPGAHNGYGYYWGVKNTPELNCKTLLYGRYEFSLQMEVKFDAERAKVMSYGEPMFFLHEVQSVTPLSEGGFYISSGELQMKFGAGDWEKLYKAHGDFSVLGVKLVKDKPVPNLEAWWKEEGKKF